MSGSPEKFAQILTEAIHTIRLRESKTVKKTIRIVQDELGYALGRDGGSAIEYWRKGHIPAATHDIENLAVELVKRDGLDLPTLQQFLESADYPYSVQLCSRLFPHAALDMLAPFVVGPPITHPRQFFGRAQELKRIFGLWSRFPLQNVAVIGPYRSGKTSLLRYIETITRANPAQLRPGQRVNWLPQPHRYRLIFIDFQNAQMRSIEPLLSYLLNCLELPIPQPCNLNSFIEVVSHRLQNPALILMDEIGAGLSSPELDQQFWWSLRSLGSNFTEGRLGFLLTAHQAPNLLAQEQGKPSPFFNIFGHTIKLGPLTEAEARELIASSPQPFAAAEVEWMLAQSGRWPALLQILCDTRLTALEEGQPGNDWQQEGLNRLSAFRYLLD